MCNRIAFISEHASPLALLGGTDSGGQNVYVAELAKQLVSLGYEIDIYTRWEDAFVSQIVSYQQGIRVIHIQAGPVEQIPKEEILCYMDEFFEDMLGFIDAEDLVYQLIHANFWMSGLVAMKLKARLNIPFVITFHALGHVRKIYQKEHDKFPPERVEIEEEIVNKADRIIAECPQDREDLLRFYHADPARVSIIPCGFNPLEFFPMDKTLSRQALRLPDEKTILQLGRMVPRKGVDNVIKALALLRIPGMQVRLVIVGGEAGTLKDSAEVIRLRKLAAALGVSDRVTFTGQKSREELKYYYDAADVFITTPWYEPFGITPLEAMACGTPVIGADVGGIKYSVIDGKTGFLVPPDSPEALCDRITVLLTDEDLLQKMGDEALQRVHAYFTWEKVALKMRNLYEAIFNTKAAVGMEREMIGAAFENSIFYLHAKRKDRSEYGS